MIIFIHLLVTLSLKSCSLLTFWAETGISWILTSYFGLFLFLKKLTTAKERTITTTDRKIITNIKFLLVLSEEGSSDEGSVYWLSTVFSSFAIELHPIQKLPISSPTANWFPGFLARSTSPLLASEIINPTSSGHLPMEVAMTVKRVSEGNVLLIKI